MFTVGIREKSNRTAKPLRVLSTISIVALALILGAATPQVWAGGAPEEFEDGEIYFELNDTDEDLGIHGLIDGGPWEKIWIKDSEHRLLMTVKAWGRLKRQAVTELFFESAEPIFSELPPEEFFDRFPEGRYKIFGWSQDRQLLRSVAQVSHVMPAPPGGITVNGVGPINHKEVNCDSDDIPEVELGVSEDVVISWDEVNSSHLTVGDDGPIDVELYQGVVEFELEVDGEDFESKYTVDLPHTRTEMTIPASFIALGLDEDGEGEFKFEILVKEAFGGNQTAAESCFAVVLVPAP